MKAYITFRNGNTASTEYEYYDSDEQWIHFYDSEGDVISMFTCVTVRSISFVG